MNEKVKTQAKVDAVRVDPLQFLKELEGGDFACDLARDIQDVTSAVKEHGRKGEVTISLVFKPQPKFGESAVIIEAESKPKAPRKSRNISLRFVADDGTLINNDPNQPAFPGMKP